MKYHWKWEYLLQPFTVSLPLTSYINVPASRGHTLVKEATSNQPTFHWSVCIYQSLSCQQHFSTCSVHRAPFRSYSPLYWQFQASSFSCSVFFRPWTIASCVYQTSTWHCSWLTFTMYRALQVTCHRLVAWLSSCGYHHRDNASQNQITLAPNLILTSNLQRSVYDQTGILLHDHCLYIKKQ